MRPILASTIVSTTTSGSLRQFINIYVNDFDIRFAQGLETPIAERDEVSIVPAVAGGGGPS